MDEKLIEKLNISGYRKGQIEAILKMPKNSLSGMMSGKKMVPEKWQKKLEEFVETVEKNRDKLSPIIVPDPGEKFDSPKFPANCVFDEPAFQSPRPWVKSIEAYCGLAGITPDQLISEHQAWSKLSSLKPQPSKIDPTQEPQNPVQVRDLNEEAKPKGTGYDLRFKKLGF